MSLKPIYQVFNILNLHDLPPTPNPLTQAQERTLLGLIARVGLPTYRVIKVQAGVDINLALPRLSRRQASRLITALRETVGDQL